MRPKGPDDAQPQRAHSTGDRRWVDVATIIVLAFTLIATVGGIYLVHRDGEAALTKAHEDSEHARKSAEAAAQSALAKAEDANKIAALSLTAVQRAFISVDELQLDRRTDGAAVYFPAIVNNGATPALITTLVAIEPRDFCEFNKTFGGQAADVDAAFTIGAPSDPELAVAKSDNTLLAIDPFLRNVVLGPHATLRPVESRGSELVESKDFSNLLNVRQLKYFYGEILYDDVFGKSHKEKYCFRVMLKEVMGPPDLVVNRCTHWNCADKFCDVDKEAYETHLAAWRREGRPSIKTKVDCSDWNID